MKNKIVHHVWEKDGQKCSSWSITAGGHTLNCNDAGKAMFDKAVLEAAKKLEVKSIPLLPVEEYATVSKELIAKAVNDYFYEK